MNRYKPVGWRYESHKHSLAAKGIATKYQASKLSMTEFLNDAKGVKTEENMGKCPVCKRYSALKGRYCVDCHAKVHGGSGDKYYSSKFKESQEERMKFPIRHLIASDDELGAISRGVAPEVYTYVYGVEDVPDNHRKEAYDELARRRVEKQYSGDGAKDREENPGYYSMKDFVGEADQDKPAFLSNHKIQGEGHMLRHRDIDSERQRAIARLDQALAEGNMTGISREDFLKDDFKSTAQEYLNGHITKEQFHDEINRELEWHVKIHRKSLSPFDWAEQKPVEVKK